MKRLLERLAAAGLALRGSLHRRRNTTETTDSRGYEGMEQESTPAPVREPGRPARSEGPRLRGLSEIYSFLRSNETPLYFVSPTPYNILGIDQWVGAFEFISYFDTFDGNHPHSFAPTHAGPREFESFESVNTHLLNHKQVIDHIHAKGKGKVLFVMFDADTEAAAADLGLDIMLPPRALRERIDSKLETTRLGDDAGVPSAPNTLGEAKSYAELLAMASAAKLGTNLVVQTPYGDSGRTTFFIRSEEDWNDHAEKLSAEPLKVMRNINHVPGTLEAVATRHGTLVGPIQTDITGHPELTPYGGGWAGNDVYPSVFDEPTRNRIRSLARKLGDRLYSEGYRGVFCFDFLLDTDSGEVYLGEINPRISGASPMTNLLTSKYGGLPLFAFHLLEFSNADWECDLAAVQQRWLEFDGWTQLVLKQTSPEVELITHAPPSGLYRMDREGNARFVRPETDWHAVAGENEAFYLRVYGRNEYRYPGADLGVVVSRGRMQTDDRQLMDRGRRWVDAITSQFPGVSPEQALTLPDDWQYEKWF